jgi:broad specificity phosphatase PhoE
VFFYLFLPPQGESRQQFETRLINSLTTLIRQNSKDNLVIITHGGAIRALMPYLLGVPKEESFKYDPQ